jgi:hypothetical protein
MAFENFVAWFRHQIGPSVGHIAAQAKPSGLCAAKVGAAPVLDRTRPCLESRLPARESRVDILRIKKGSNFESRKHNESERRSLSDLKSAAF